MEIHLVKELRGIGVHGTDNLKKTGCGINLLKADAAINFNIGGAMHDMKELTCEKCKTVLAKRMIKESNKEMFKELKEEKEKAAVVEAPVKPPPKAPKPPKPAPAEAPVVLHKKPVAVPPPPPPHKVPPPVAGELPPLKVERYDPRLAQKKKSYEHDEDVSVASAVTEPAPTPQLSGFPTAPKQPVVPPTFVQPVPVQELDDFVIPAPPMPKPPADLSGLEQFAIPAPPPVQHTEQPRATITPMPAPVPISGLEDFAIPAPTAPPKPVQTAPPLGVVIVPADSSEDDDDDFGIAPPPMPQPMQYSSNIQPVQPMQPAAVAPMQYVQPAPVQPMQPAAVAPMQYVQPAPQTIQPIQPMQPMQPMQGVQTATAYAEEVAPQTIGIAAKLVDDDDDLSGFLNLAARQQNPQVQAVQSIVQPVQEIPQYVQPVQQPVPPAQEIPQYTQVQPVAQPQYTQEQYDQYVQQQQLAAQQGYSGEQDEAGTTIDHELVRQHQLQHPEQYAPPEGASRLPNFVPVNLSNKEPPKADVQAMIRKKRKPAPVKEVVLHTPQTPVLSSIEDVLSELGDVETAQAIIASKETEVQDLDLPGLVKYDPKAYSQSKAKMNQLDSQMSKNLRKR